MSLQTIFPNTPVPLSKLLTDDSIATTKPQSLSIDGGKWGAEFNGYDNYAHNSGVYVFLWNGKESELPPNTEHWVKGKQKGDSDPDPLPDGVKHMRGITLKGKRSKKQYVYYKGEWVFQLARLWKGGHVPLYVGKSTNVANRIQQHLYWPDSYAAKYIDELKKNRQEGYFRIPRYNTASQFSDHLFRHNRNEKGLRDFGHPLKACNVSIAVSFAGFADYANRFFNEDLLIGQLRPPFNLDSER
jgi:hypothetical protein